jgi:tRNA (guanine37-N1)-methyltransferase
MLRFTAVTLFPEMFEVIRGEGVVARGIERGLVGLDAVNPRDFAPGPRRNVDEHPVGGGDGMVIRPDVAAATLQSVLTPESYVVHLSPTGKVFDASAARGLSKKRHVVLLCGRYAGFDFRTVHRYVHAEFSIGDFVLSGGELPAMCLVDAVSRFVPGVLGNSESAACDSFEDGLLEAPVFTKPLDFEGDKVPDVLLSGDHARIAAYRRKEQLRVTARNRPDLLNRMWDKLSRAEKAMVERVWKNG